MLGMLIAAAIVALIAVAAISWNTIIKELKKILLRLKLKDGEAQIKKIYSEGGYNKVEVNLYSGKRFFFFRKKVGGLIMEGKKLDPELRNGQKMLLTT